MNIKMLNKAIFLDRDGVINQKAAEHEYITTWEDFHFLPNVLKALEKISKTEYTIIIVSNQRGISRGKMSKVDLDHIHKNMIKEIKKYGGRIDKIYYCPHGYDECKCRKPLPGMLDTAKSNHSLCLEDSWIIGDSSSDIHAGKARKCKTIYIGEKDDVVALSDYSVKSLDEAVNVILQDH
jgi:D-glycero-D-manno-heptose 1,7-bisphosphate phosphatase